MIWRKLHVSDQVRTVSIESVKLGSNTRRFLAGLIFRTLKETFRQKLGN